MPAMPNLPRIVVLLACCGVSVEPASAAEEGLIVRLASGREFAGAIDPSSDEEQLVLRSGHAGMTVRRPIRWERIVAVTSEGKPVEVAALREMALAGSREAGVGGRGAEVRDQRSEVSDPRSAVEKIAIEESVLQEVAGAESPREVVSVSFDAVVANWDADVETDGLVIDLRPMDANGFVIPVDGTLQVELFAPQRRTLHHAPHSGGDTLELVERWTRSISASSFGASGGRLRLPFGAVHPEIDVEWLASWYGLVHVRIAIPGQGVFEDSRDGVRIRPWAPNRDSLEMNTGRRFVPTEGLGRRD